MKVRRLQVTLVTIVAMLGAVLAGTGFQPAAAAPSSAIQVVENCDHYTGGGNGAIVPGGAAWVRLNGDGPIVGSVQLCREGSSHTNSLFWAYVVFHRNGAYSPLPTGRWGTAVLQIDRSGRGGPIDSWSCDSPISGRPNGANGHVAPGESRCWTPKIAVDLTWDWVRALGYRANSPYPVRNWDAWGIGPFM